MIRTLQPGRAIWLAIALAVAWAASDARADSVPGLPPGRSPVAAPAAATVERLRTQGVPFGPGERLRFSIEYGPVKAGTATLEVKAVRNYRGRPCYHIVSEATSSSFFDKIYRVRNRMDTLVDAERFVTWQYRKVEREGTYRADVQAVYDHGSRRVRYADGQILEFPAGAIDALGAFYRARLEKLEPGTSFYLPHHSDKRSYYLEVKVLGRESVKVPAGSFRCVTVEPLVGDGGPFQHQGRLTIWLTDDDRHMPVLMKCQVPVGSIQAALSDWVLGSPATLAESGSKTGS